MHTHHWPAQQRVHAGAQALETALPAECRRLGWQRVLLVTTRSLRDSELCARVRALLGDAYRDTVTGIPAHSPIEAVATLVGQCRETGVDGIVALGGGSVIDACKAALLALNVDLAAADVTAAALQAKSNPRFSEWASGPLVRMVAIPTTLSAAEFTSFCGVTDTANARKISAAHPSMVPISVIQDPVATRITPARLLLSTGARAVDHAVEGFCAPNATAFSDATAVEGARRLFAALPALARDLANDAAHSDAQAGAWLSIQGRANGVWHGASHGIGYILGAAFGVPHGETSCVMLPAVLRWNESVNGDRQRALSRRLELDVNRSLADAVERLFDGAGLPTRLSQVGVTRDDFARIANLYDGTGPIANNPRPIGGPADLQAILELAA